MMHSLDAMHQCLSQSFKIIFEDKRSVRVKTWAIEKLIKASGQSVAGYFKKWRQMVAQIKVLEEINKKQKTTALRLFANVLGGTEVIQIKEALFKFQKNVAITKVSKNFFNRLLKTKSGRVVQLFETWRSIPDAKIAKKKKKAIKFESNLNKMFIKFAKYGY